MKPASHLPLLAPTVVTAVAAVVLLVVPGCGNESRSGDEPGGGGSGGEFGFSLETYCNQVAGAACLMAESCSNPTLFGNRRLGHNACRLEVEETCVAEGLEWLRSVRGGGLAYDAAALRDCLDEVGHAQCTQATLAWGLLSCDDTPGGRVCDRFFFGTAQSDSCAGVFTGAVALGDPCYHDRECAEDAWCDEATGVLCPGRCREGLDRGKRCADQAEACKPGLVCTGEGSIKLCRPEAQEGGECVTLENSVKPTCAPPLQCLYDEGCNPAIESCFGACRALLSAGDACGERTARCEPDTYCAYKSPISREGWCEPFKGQDEECDDILGDPRPCGNALHCFGPGIDQGKPGRPGTSGRCKPYPTYVEESGPEACVRNDGNCVDAYCTAGGPTWEGYCMPLKEVGEDCAGKNHECRSQFCQPEGAGGSWICVSAADRIEAQRCVRPDDASEEPR